ncbi:unnamed protein product [Mytilus edulis]|uniref:QRICH1-like domain-containing protein n=1 Tax=Mytilus edulis TaxID=6550 RepID=A0A8S3T4C8_MYTED|nr:unnamed protein product [Mytilus edulis]
MLNMKILLFEKLEDLTLSQALDQYEVDFEMDDLPDFELTQVPLTADNIIKELEKAVTENCSENSRYSVVEDIDIDMLVKSTESRNTRKNTTWSVATFNDWRVARMKSNYCAIPELLQFTANDVNQWLSKFVIETRRKDGKPYPPKTLYLLCVGILRFHRENGVHMNFLDEKDCVFYDFRRSLSARMTELTKQGIGTTTKQAEAISEETEITLWEKGLLGSGLNQRNLSAKNLKHYLQNPVLFKIYEQYLNIVRDLDGTAFYRRPLDKGSIKFGEQSVGVNKLSNIMKTMCAEAGIDGYFTNNSGKRTCATTLYQTRNNEQDRPYIGQSRVFENIKGLPVRC